MAKKYIDKMKDSQMTELIDELKNTGEEAHHAKMMENNQVSA